MLKNERRSFCLLSCLKHVTDSTESCYGFSNKAWEVSVIKFFSSEVLGRRLCYNREKNTGRQIKMYISFFFSKFSDTFGKSKSGERYRVIIFYYLLVSVNSRPIIVWGPIFELSISMSIHVLRFPESENTIF